jgi:hybrid polyketide synthase / nonribosomal peptide synthetase ACE1
MIYNRAAFRSTALIPTSEREFYQLFAEAVIAGKTGSGWDTDEILNRLRKINPHDKDRPVWEAKPLMSHFVASASDLGQASSSQQRVPLKTQLAEAINRSQVRDIIQNSFLPQLYNILRMDPAKYDRKIMIATRLDEMGMDSLLAVEIRGWFMKTLQVNIPILKILSGVPISNLIDMAADTIPERLTPSLTAVSTGSHAEVLDSPSHQEIIGGSKTEAGAAKSSGKHSPNSSDEDSTHAPIPEIMTLQPTVQKTLRLSFSQDMFWFTWMFLSDKKSLNHTAWARITGKYTFRFSNRLL